jgi:hypothetical protein
MSRSFVVFVALLAVTIGSSARDNGPTPTLPTPGPTVTDTFTGTVNLNGSITHSFSTGSAGTVTATITTVAPSGAVLGFQLGTWNTVTCTAVLSNDLATANSVLSAITQSSASLCVKIHDPNGALTDNSVNYTVTVTHQ